LEHLKGQVRRPYRCATGGAREPKVTTIVRKQKLIFTRATPASSGISCRRVSVCLSATSRCSTVINKQRNTIAQGL